MKGCEDLLLITLHSHMITAAKSILRERKFERVKDLAKEIISFLQPDVKVVSNDKKYLYTLQVLTLTFLWHGFNDSVHEVDGDRLMVSWKNFPLFSRLHNILIITKKLFYCYHF